MLLVNLHLLEENIEQKLRKKINLTTANKTQKQTK